MSTTATHQNQHVNPHFAGILSMFAPSVPAQVAQKQPTGKDCYNCGVTDIRVKHCPVCGACVTCQI